MVDCKVEISFPAVHWGGPLPLFLLDMDGLWGLYFEGIRHCRIVEDAQIQSWTLLIDQLKTKERPFAGVMCPFCHMPFVAFPSHQFKVC